MFEASTMFRLNLNSSRVIVLRIIFTDILFFIDKRSWTHSHKDAIKMYREVWSSSNTFPKGLCKSSCIFRSICNICNNGSIPLQIQEHILHNTRLIYLLSITDWTSNDTLLKISNFNFMNGCNCSKICGCSQGQVDLHVLTCLTNWNYALQISFPTTLTRSEKYYTPVHHLRQWK